MDLAYNSMIIAYLKNPQQQSHSKKPSKEKCHSVLIIHICIKKTYLDFLASSHVCGDQATIPQLQHGVRTQQCGITLVETQNSLCDQLQTLFNDKSHLISRKGTAQPLSKQLHLMTPLKDSETKSCIIFIYSKEQRSHHFPLGRSKSFLTLENKHEDLRGHCRNSQQNFWDKEKYSWHDYNNLSNS